MAAPPSVATSGTDNSERLAWPSGSFAGIAFIKKVFEDVSNELERKVLECIGGPMEQPGHVCFRGEAHRER